ncbi:MAG TPA: hypothetical protein VFJ97_02535 [Dermatophilaceae bacterium]|nr:hypothetical protein [Dermatophilaceae bacterium]
MTTRTDKRVLRRALLATRGNVGKTLPAISKVADRGLLWPILCSVMCLHRTTRRAGAGGLGAVLVTSALTNCTVRP